MKKLLVSLLVILSLLIPISCSAAAKPSFTLAWSIYVGWMPWPYAAESGILKKWADKYNIQINLKQFDYVPSIEAYSAGKVDAVTITNMDSFAVVGAVPSTVVTIGDYSNDNDQVIVRDNLTFKDFPGKEVYIVEGSVSQYLLARGLQTVGLSEKDVKIMNTSDSDIGSAFLANKNQKIVVTWNPIVFDILDQDKTAKNIFGSSKIPNEIMDMLLVRSDKVKTNPEFAKALVGAWYETIALMKAKDSKAISSMAKLSGSTVESFNKQLSTTYMYWTPQETINYMQSSKLVEVMDSVRKFSFEHGMFGEGYKNADAIGIALPNSKVLGDKNNIRFTFTDEFLK